MSRVLLKVRLQFRIIKLLQLYSKLPQECLILQAICHRHIIYHSVVNNFKSTSIQLTAYTICDDSAVKQLHGSYKMRTNNFEQLNLLL